MADIPDIDDDPCGRVAALRAIRDAVLTGKKAGRVRFRSGNAERELQFNGVDLDALTRELRQAESACAAKSGKAPARRAIRFGGTTL